MSDRFRNVLLATSALIPLSVIAAVANPLGSQVVGGSANVQGQGTPRVTVTQSTDRAIINWNTFNISKGETTRFIQPSASSVTLNRVTGNLGPSFLDGMLSANGRIFLVNPDGILFGANSRIDTAGFLATTNDIKNADLMAGRYQFNIPGRPDASIINQGMITAQNGGFAALVAPGVRNTGTITARLGSVGLASANGFSLDFYGDKLITLGLADSIAAKVIDVSTGQPLDALVKNEGKLKANGGRVELTAVAARQVVDSVINNRGVIEANSIGTKNGMIVLGAATASTKPDTATVQTVKLSGELSAAGKRKNSKGGTVVVSGENIEVASATIDSSGQAGGGKVLIGGDVGGGRGNAAVAENAKAALESFAVSTASNVTVDAKSRIDASATKDGEGGKIVVWSNQATTFDGVIRARGGAEAGSGGFVETSGKGSLVFNGIVDTSAPRGIFGTLLLDPADYYILATGSPAVPAGASSISSGQLQNQLSLGNVVIATDNGTHPAGQNGDIFVNSAVSWSANTSLTLDAFRNIQINAAVNGINGTFSLNAGGTITASAALNVGTFDLRSGVWSQIAPSLPNLSANDFRLSGGTFIRALAGDGSIGSPFEIADVYGLQGIGSSGMLAKNYLLANDIDASGTRNWNSGAGFTPIGTIFPFFGVLPFTGTLDGQSRTIDRLYINSPNPGHVGLFGLVGSAGVVKNLGLTRPSIGGTGNSVGGIAGTNDGLIFQSYVSAPGFQILGEIAGTTNFETWGGTYVVGNYVYVAANTGGLRIVDISNPKSPALVGAFTGISEAFSVIVSGRYAYVADNATGLNIIDVSNPTNPVLVGVYGLSGRSFTLAIGGNYVYAPNILGGVVNIIDVSNPTNPVLAGSYTTNAIFGNPYAVALAGHHLYVSDIGTRSIYTIDVSNPTAPSLVNAYSTNVNEPFGLSVSGNHLYVADNTRFSILDISNPTAVLQVGEFSSSAIYWGVRVAGNYAYLSERSGRIAKFDIGQPASPALVGMGVLGAQVQDMTVEGSYGYLWTHAGLKIVDVGSVNGVIFGGQSFAGAIAGTNSGTVSYSYSNSVVAGYHNAGGFVGRNQGAISHSYSVGDVSGQVRFFNAPITGGFVASNTGSVSQSYSTGLTGWSGSPGFIGQNLGTVISSYWDTESSRQPASDGGVGLTTAQLKSGLPSEFDGSVWAINPALNAGYPHLRWQSPTTQLASPSNAIAYSTLPPGVPPFPKGQVEDLLQPTRYSAINSNNVIVEMLTRWANLMESAPADIIISRTMELGTTILPNYVPAVTRIAPTIIGFSNAYVEGNLSAVYAKGVDLFLVGMASTGASALGPYAGWLAGTAVTILCANVSCGPTVVNTIEVYGAIANQPLGFLGNPGR